MADVLDVTGANPFKVGAYQRAARALEEMTDDVSRVADLDHLTEIQGIGKRLAEKIVEFVRTGRVEEIEQALARVPPGVLELMSIPGLGPKSVAVLWQKGGVESLEDLKKKLATGELEKLPRMGARTLEKIGKSLAFAESSGHRVRLGDALPMAELIVQALRKLKQVARADYAGSVRRGVETIGDVDVVCGCRDVGRDGPTIAAAFKSLPMVQEVIASGATKVSVRTAQGMQVDLRIVEDDHYGAALLYFTGSKAHNIALRERAIKKGLRLNEYGLWSAQDFDEAGMAQRVGEEVPSRGRDFRKTGRPPVAGATEQDIYEALKLMWMPPELREDRGEIQVSELEKIPELLQVADIKAELHAHTVASDGHWTIEELAAAARERGFHTVAVTDHSASQAIANGLDTRRLEMHIKAIRAANDKVHGITILAGTEVDILPDGKLDYADSLLAELDIVIASPHMGLTHDPERATKRLLAAIENPYVHIIGHPTGRMILRREGLSPDMSRVIKAAADTGTALEINANSYRLDLRDTHARAAIEAGVLLAINTDAHGPADLDQLRFGVLTARRAWVQPRHVVNCMTAGQLQKWLKAKRNRLL
jgi:DNA polymerase (family X)